MSTKPDIDHKITMDHIVILCSQLKQSLRFYTDLLPLIGFSQSEPHLFSNAQGIALDFRQSTQAEHSYQRHAPGLNHLGFQVESLAQIEDIKAQMEQLGHTLPAIQEFPDGHAIFIPDPDGLRVEIGCYKMN